MVGRPSSAEFRSGLMITVLLVGVAGNSAVIQSSRRSSRVAARTVPCGSTMKSDS